MGDVFGPLKYGKNSMKLGARVTKGAWAGSKIYYLQLEERKTCPPCRHELDCYGNNMLWGKRMRHGAELIIQVERQLDMLNRVAPFVVRLHTLGDFYALGYVDQWQAWLKRFRGLRVFGYTAHEPDSEIGRAIGKMNGPRCRIRFSNSRLRTMAAITVGTEMAAAARGAIVCPAQRAHPTEVGKTRTECCATCALCWSTTKNIAFLRH